MSTSALQISGYLRASAYSIAFFDYLQTLPAEYRCIHGRKDLSSFRATACILFILVHYLGLASIIIGNTGFFYHGFTEASCRRYYWLAQILKLLLYMTSQAILGLRTYAVSRRVHLFVLEAHPIPFQRQVSIVVLDSTGWVHLPILHSCTSGNPPGVHLASLYYVGWLTFDVVTMLISTAYLWKFSGKNRFSRSQFAKMMLEDGIVYFIALSAMNIVNIVFYNNPITAVQASAGPLGFAFTMIFSGRFILNLSEYVRDGISGEQSSSRTPVGPASHHRGFRAGNQLASVKEQDGGLVVKVVQNVLKRHGARR
ncbi:hypothetical protein C8J57DRAFT_1502372 [Mycena rebaudengoi]|nr:hypothetical protein C8J57DRAFT_1502372 [Mycena rebaudengoi]